MGEHGGGGSAPLPFLVSDENLVGIYLRIKNECPRLNVSTMIEEVDFYGKSPWTLFQEYPLASRCATNHCCAYFFSRPYRGEDGSNRFGGDGFWSLICDGRYVDLRHNYLVLGRERVMVFYGGLPTSEGRYMSTRWAVREFRLVGEDGNMIGDWVLCKLRDLSRELDLTGICMHCLLDHDNPRFRV